MAKKKIAFFINSLASAGAEKVVALLINELKNDYDVHLIMLNPTIEVDLKLENVVIKIIDTSKLTASNRIIDILKIPLIAIKLKRYLNKNGITLCISFLNRSNFINACSKKLLWKGKIILCERAHTSSVYSNKNLSGKTARFLVKYLYKYADLIIANAIGIAEDLKENYDLQNKMQVIYNPINLSLTSQKASVPVEDISFSKFTFVMVGRFHEYKNHHLLLDAVALIKDLNFQVLLIGKGSLENEVKLYAKKLNILHKIIFLGYKDNSLKYVEKCNCTLLTSTVEGFPNVLLESLACGIPVISTDCQTGPRELLNGNYLSTSTTKKEYLKYGILLPLNDKASLAEAMRSVIQDENSLSSYKGIIKTRAEDFAADKIINQFKTSFESVM